MTVRTMPVQPGQAAGPAGPGPGLWRGMLWVTWRQHRGLLITVPATFVVAVAGTLVAGLKIHHDYAIVAACHPVHSAACQQLGDWFLADWHLGNGIRVALLAVTVLLAMFAGTLWLVRRHAA